MTDAENRAEAEGALVAWLASEFPGCDIDVRLERLTTSFALLGVNGQRAAPRPAMLQVAKYLLEDEGRGMAEILRTARLHDEPSIQVIDALRRGGSVRVERNDRGLLVALRVR
jgi:hypothetical protein